MSDEVTVQGLNKLARKIEKLGGKRATTAKVNAMQRTVNHLRDVVAKYPPSTQANSPPGVSGYSWYQRGFGTKTVTGLAYATSETLGRRWTDKVFPSGNQGEIGNNASYAVYVQDREQQATFHKQRGWVTVQDAVESESETILGFWALEYRMIINEPS